MPLYEYQCRSCRQTAEVRHGMKETFDGACANCGGEMARVFTPTGIVFKGSGFYLTDSRKAAEAKTGDAPSKAPETKEGATAPAASSETPSSPGPAPAAAPAATPAPAAAKSESAA